MTERDRGHTQAPGGIHSWPVGLTRNLCVGPRGRPLGKEGPLPASTCFGDRKSGFKKACLPPGGESTGRMGAECRGREETGAGPAGRREGVNAKLVLGARLSDALVYASSGSL